MNVLTALRTNPVLSTGSQDALERAAAKSELRLLDCQQILVRAGMPQSHVYLLVKGRLQLHGRNVKTKRQMLMGVLDPPALFGDAELYAPKQPWLVTARAATSMILVAVPVDAYDEMVSSDLSISRGLYRETCARHFLTMQLMGLFALESTEQMILKLLLSAVRRDVSPGEPLFARIPMVVIARALGVSAKTVSRNLRSLEGHGLITRSRAGAYEIASKAASMVGPAFPRGGFGASWRLAS